MTFESLVALAKENRASDLHLEPGLPAGLRISGALKTLGEPMPGNALVEMARGLLGEHRWPDFQARWSYDLSTTVSGVRCRVNVMRTKRGVGMAIRLLPGTQPNLRTLNLHPELRRLVGASNGLVLVSGPTGSGKSSTLAALIQEINLSEARHIVTVESPIEYDLSPRKAFIRQREVGRDTPSFQQALLDALREDPDVLMVGEMRETETMRLTLNAAETGHLVLATVHSGTVSEALQRVVGAFPSEVQSAVAAQLADCLVGVICQRLQFRPELRIRIPECEVLVASTPVRATIRQGQFYKLASALESGGQEGCWTFSRYRDWLSTRTDWYRPEQEPASAPTSSEPALEAPDLGPRSSPSTRPQSARATTPRRPPAPPGTATDGAEPEDGVLVIPSAEEDLDRLVSELEKAPAKKGG
jgi:twitching motility protein PilT